VTRFATPGMIIAGKAAYLDWMLRQPAGRPLDVEGLCIDLYFSMDEAARKSSAAPPRVAAPPVQDERSTVAPRSSGEDTMARLVRVLRRFSDADVVALPDWSNEARWRELKLDADFGIPRSFIARLMAALEREFALPPTALGYPCGDLDLGAVYDLVVAWTPDL